MIRQVPKIFFTLVMLAVLGACSGDDSTTINIEAPSNNGGDSSGGGDPVVVTLAEILAARRQRSALRARLKSARDCANCPRLSTAI